MEIENRNVLIFNEDRSGETECDDFNESRNGVPYWRCKAVMCRSLKSSWTIGWMKKNFGVKEDCHGESNELGKILGMGAEFYERFNELGKNSDLEKIFREGFDEWGETLMLGVIFLSHLQLVLMWGAQ